VSESTADLSDELGERLQYCQLSFRQYGRRLDFAGPVTTVQCFQDIGLLRSVLGKPGAGGVLVVDGGGSMRTALLGDSMAQLAIDSGWAGLVINGVVRDTRALADMDIGIKALGSSPRRGGRTGDGRHGIPVTFGGAVFRPGERLVSDEDGVIVLDPRQLLASP
jgi:regulator of ribonuclease activity A